MNPVGNLSQSTDVGQTASFSGKVRKSLFFVGLALRPGVDRRVLLWRARSFRRVLEGATTYALRIALGAERLVDFCRSIKQTFACRSEGSGHQNDDDAHGEPCVNYSRGPWYTYFHVCWTCAPQLSRIGTIFTQGESTQQTIEGRYSCFSIARLYASSRNTHGNHLSPLIHVNPTSCS